MPYHVRLGTYTAKVPVYNSLKVLTVPCSFEQVKPSSNVKWALPKHELYIIVNGNPTKSKVVWRTLVDVNVVKTAIKELRESKWPYREVHNESVDEAAK